MLPEKYKFWIVNNLGQDIDYDDGGRIDLRLKPWKLVAGVRTEIDVITDDFAFSAADQITDEAFEAMETPVDNTTNKGYGLHGSLHLVADNAASLGSVDLYVEYTDDAGSFPSALTTVQNPEKYLIFLTSIQVPAGHSADDAYTVNFEM